MLEYLYLGMLSKFPVLKCPSGFLLYWSWEREMAVFIYLYVLSLYTSPIASMLGWLLYFTTHFQTGLLALLARGSQFKYSALLRLLAMLEKKVLKKVCNFSSIIVTHNSLFFIYCSFPKCFVIIGIFLIQISEIAWFK